MGEAEVFRRRNPPTLLLWSFFASGGRFVNPQDACVPGLVAVRGHLSSAPPLPGPPLGEAEKTVAYDTFVPGQIVHPACRKVRGLPAKERCSNDLFPVHRSKWLEPSILGGMRNFRTHKDRFPEPHCSLAADWKVWPPLHTAPSVTAMTHQPGTSPPRKQALPA